MVQAVLISYLYTLSSILGEIDMHPSAQYAYRTEENEGEEDDDDDDNNEESVNVSVELERHASDIPPSNDNGHQEWETVPMCEWLGDEQSHHSATLNSSSIP